MTIRTKITTLVAAILFTLAGAALIHLSPNDQPAPAERVTWQQILGIIFGLIGILGIIGAMVVIITTLLPQALNAPDAADLRAEDPHGPNQHTAGKH